jgi:ABC-type uncharacterized transport system permease subunit
MFVISPIELNGEMNLPVSVDILVIVIPLLYVVLVTFYAISFFGSSSTADRFKSPLLMGTLVAHLAYITLRTIAFDHPPITTVFEIMTLLALCISIGYTYIETRTKATNTGFFILSLACVFQAVSSLFIKDVYDVPQILHSKLLGFHVSAALLGYAAISLSAVYGFLYLMLYHEIKSNRFGRIYNRLPNLEMLEKMNHKSELFGFFMLSVAIAVGLFWLPRAFENFSYWDPKLIGTLMIWFLYAIALATKKTFGWQGRKTILISIIAFGFVFLSMTVINMYMSGFHTFY